MATTVQGSTLCLQDTVNITPEARVFAFASGTIFLQVNTGAPDDQFDSRPQFRYFVDNDPLQFTVEKLNEIQEDTDYYYRYISESRFRIATSPDADPIPSFTTDSDDPDPADNRELAASFKPYLPLGEVVSMAMAAGSNTVLDQSLISDTHRTRLTGLKDFGQATFELLANEADADRLYIAKSGTALRRFRYFQPGDPIGRQPAITIPGYLTQMTLTSAVDDLLRISITVESSGKVEYQNR